ncbi:helix-turn-helix domain-containing protein [Vibrio misgurnus]|uniref:helix-turn-helix domain-containing protein n=1 Tax=Vibrio misgurnus TaxID=2993714 RepID=UPI0023F71097|nr:helix-turn-helix domain-containing protein [Vibrio sp. VCS]
MYHYTECGLDNVYLENGYTLEIEDGEQFVSFDDFEGIHQAIAMAICEQSVWLSKEQFKFLRKELNLSQSALGALLFCDRQTVARWEKGDTPISRAQDVLLRAIYTESINRESHVALMLEALADADIADQLQKVVLHEDPTGKWHRVERCAIA